MAFFSLSNIVVMQPNYVDYNNNNSNHENRSRLATYVILFFEFYNKNTYIHTHTYIH